jgi:hypothetical protein
MEEAATPFPSEETTPPVTKIYFGAILAVRGFKRELIGPPQETYKELWMQREKLSIANATVKINICNEFCDWSSRAGRKAVESAGNSGVSEASAASGARKLRKEPGTFRLSAGK